MWLSRIGFRCVSPGEKTKQRAETSDTLACNCRHEERRAERGGATGPARKLAVRRARVCVVCTLLACLRVVCVCAGRAGVLACWRACLRAFVVACACARARARARAHHAHARAAHAAASRARRARACTRVRVRAQPIKRTRVAQPSGNVPKFRSPSAGPALADPGPGVQPNPSVRAACLPLQTENAVTKPPPAAVLLHTTPRAAGALPVTREAADAASCAAKPRPEVASSRRFRFGEGGKLL